ncbi:MAG: Gfo/Idh/MocA family oxidoreductase, partial [Planctomycetes bacterium]|nr:Gfo/Idh/MocA family oxidoreductase [Planctomycetota bacterium]
IPSTARGANERVVVGFIGTGHRARQLMDHLPKDAARIVAISDCYVRRMDETLAQKKTNWRTYQNYRKMLDAEKLDAVVVATPDHGRVLPCIHACQAGLDVYAEKPLTLTIAEGRVLVQAARKYERVFQVGSQQRTMEMNRFACELVRTGGIGKIKVVLAVNYPGPRRYQGLPEEPIPEGDDWDMWQGQAPERPFNRQLQFNLDAMASLLGRRNDQLGRSRMRPDSMGLGDEPLRTGRSVAGHRRPVGKGLHAVRQRRCGSLRAGAGTARRRDLRGREVQDRNQPK